METSAIQKFHRLSAQKARLVATQVRGMPVEKAVELLSFSNKKARSDHQEGSRVGDCQCRAQRRRRHRRIEDLRRSASMMARPIAVGGRAHVGA